MDRECVSQIDHIDLRRIVLFDPVITKINGNIGIVIPFRNIGDVTHVAV